jgi:hypothetical protein
VTTLHRDPAPTAGRSEWRTSELRRVVIRLADGDVVQAGTAPNPDSARSLARSVAREIDHPTTDWPRIGDRHLRPEAVVSIDVVSVW